MSIFRIGRLAGVFAFAAVLVGCAHPISINAEKAPERVESNLIQKKVAYAMSDAERGKQVSTPGGGGDKVSYYPYRDLEKTLRDALRAVYQEVVVVKSATDLEGIRSAGADLVFTPEIKTDSSSASAFTWPPTFFKTEIACIVTDPTGVEVTRVQAAGDGTAQFSEFKSNLGLSASRSASAVAAKLVEEIRRDSKLR